MRITKKQAMGIITKVNEQVKRSAKKEIDPKLFIALCKAHGIPRPIAQFQFHPERKWRFDWSWPWETSKDIPVALEIQGGIFTQGRHTRGAALLKEMEKLNEAAILGYRILYCTPKDVETGAIFPTIKRALGL